MSSFSAPHSLVQPQRPDAAPAAKPTTTESAPARRETYEEQTHRETLTIVKLTAVGVVIVLALFLTMMVILGGYGPSNPL